MPANLTPEYYAVEKEYREAKDPRVKLRCLEKMLRVIPKHKGTDHMQGDLKRRISRLKESLEKTGAKKGFSVSVDREGAGQLAMVGWPNSGKSSLVEVVTNARVAVADYPFSTREPVPAMMPYENIQFQLVDMPPISSEYMEPWVTDIIRTADGAIWVVDPAEPRQDESLAEVQEILLERKVELVPPGHPEVGQQLRVRRIPTILVAAKMDLEEAEAGLQALRERFGEAFDILPLSALGDSDFSSLATAVFDLCRVIRVYSKTPGHDPDLSKPFILHHGDTLIQFAAEVHKDFAENLKYARVWGEGKFDGQRIQREQELCDGDIVELHD